MIGINYNQTAMVKRLADVPGTNKREFTTILGFLKCHIQPLDSKITGDIQGGFGKDWIMFCPTADIEEGDRIIHGTKEYRVVGVESFDFIDQPHMEIIIRIFES